MEKTKYQYQRRDLVSEQEVEITQIIVEEPKSVQEKVLEGDRSYHENYYG